jgi:hypothetical protein
MQTWGGDSFMQSLFLLSCFPATFYLTDHLVVYVFKIYFYCMLLPFLTTIFLIKKVLYVFHSQLTFCLHTVLFFKKYARIAKFHFH